MSDDSSSPNPNSADDSASPRFDNTGMIERLEMDADYDPIELAIHSVRYQLAKTIVAGRRVLDVACGTGYGAALMAKWGATSVDAVDVNQDAVNSARENFDAANITFHCHDASNIGKLFDKPFDVIVCCETIEHLASPESFLQQLSGLTDENSSIIVTCPNDRYYYGAGESVNAFHKNQFSWMQFRKLCEQHLGEGDWYFAGPANGFAIFSMTELTGAANDYRSAMYRAVDMPATLIEPVADNRLTGSSSLFYAGVFGQAANKNSLRTATLFPAHADYRMPQFSCASPEQRRGRRRRMALVVDTENWAFDNIAGHVKANLHDRYDMKIFYTSQYAGNGDDLFYELFYDYQPDHIHFFWREQIFNFLKNPNRIQKMLLARDLDVVDFSRRFSECVISTAIYDHLHSEPASINDRLKPLGLIDAYSVASPFLAAIYEEGFTVPPAGMTEDGVDLQLFQPRNLQRFDQPDRPLVVGWAGNSKWGEKHADDPKGYHSIIVPAIQSLNDKGMNITGNFADRDAKWRPRSEMPQYYSEIDVLLCASLHEGTPNPVLEAMASGVPIISTDVGIVRMAVGRKQLQFIMRERSAECMIELLSRLYNQRSLLKELSLENLDSIRSWDWQMKMPKWLRLFHAAEQRHAAQRPFKYTCMLQMLETMAVVKKVKDANARLRKVNERLIAEQENSQQVKAN